MITAKLVLMILAFIAFCFAAFGTQTRINLTAAGLAAWVLALIIS